MKSVLDFKMNEQAKATLAVAAVVVVAAVFFFNVSPWLLFVFALAALAYLQYGKAKPDLPGVEVLKDDVKRAREEVFHVGDNKFSFEESDAVCRAYGAQLASYSQVEESYEKGGEWCSYGWSQDGLALFPTQDATWEKKYKKDPKHSCGRPGVNGGYFDPTMKFGVNCYGVKPAASQAELDAMFDAKRHGSPESRQKQALVERLKQELQSIKVLPWNATSWNEPVRV